MCFWSRHRKLLCPSAWGPGQGNNTSHMVCMCNLAWTPIQTCTTLIVGSGGHAVEHRTVNREDRGSIPPTAVSKLRQFCSPHICLCLSEETLKSRWSLLSGVYARGSKRSHTGGKCVTCSELTNSREEQLLR